MRRTIRLLGISKTLQDDAVKLQFHFQDSTKSQPEDLFFTFPLFCKDELVLETCDAFFLALYPICARRDIDLASDIPASEDFYRKLHALNTFLGYVSHVYHTLNISAETTVFQKRGAQEWRLASGSLGVDCLHTLYCCENNPLYQRPTHLIFNNTGSNEEGGKLHQELLQGRIANTQLFCKQYGYEFLFVDSNYKSLFDMRYGYTHLFVNSAIAYMLGHSASLFFASSSGDISNTLAFDGTPGHIDYLLYPYLSTSTVSFCFVEGDLIQRYDKIKHLVNYPPAQNYLNVCFDFAKNCCKCGKCRRTLMALESLDAVDRFSQCFSQQTYAENKDHIFADLLLDYQKGDLYVQQIMPHFKRKLTFKHRLLAWYKRSYSAIRHLRGGVTLTNLLHLKCW